MDEQTTRLVETFDLGREVAEFIRRRAAEKAGTPQKFRFEGMRKYCGCRTPHVPHCVGSYSTVRFGRLAEYCLGESGNGLEVVIESSRVGSPEYPSSASGYWVGEVVAPAAVATA